MHHCCLLSRKSRDCWGPRWASQSQKSLRFRCAMPEDLCKKDPCDFNMEMFVPKVGNPCPTLGQLLASQILCAILAGEKQHEITRARLCKRLANSWSTPRQLPHPMGSCRGLPCNSPLAAPEERKTQKKRKETRNNLKHTEESGKKTKKTKKEWKKGKKTEKRKRHPSG